MIRSMTGYGKAERMIGGVPTTLEVRCVNGRYLELSTRIPKEWSDKEGAIRETIRENVSRGSLSLYVRQEDVTTATSVAVDVDVARAYADALRGLQRELGLAGELTIDHLLPFNAIFQGGKAQEGAPDVWPEIKLALVECLTNLNTMRTAEGAELERDFESRLTAMEASLVVIEQRSAERVPLERERLFERVRTLMGEETFDEQRLMLEIVILSEKLDVTEESVRLRSHFKFFRENLAETQAVGRKLNFLLQEMNREVNTIGSKTNDAEIAKLVVGMKEELERIREQIQNVE